MFCFALIHRSCLIGALSCPCFRKGFYVKTSGEDNIDWEFCVCVWWGSITATGRYNFVGADVFDTHALMRHPSNFVLHVRLVPFLRRYNVQHHRDGFGTKSNGCFDRIEQLMVSCHLHVSSQTIHREKRR